MYADEALECGLISKVFDTKEQLIGKDHDKKLGKRAKGKNIKRLLKKQTSPLIHIYIYFRGCHGNCSFDCKQITRGCR